MEKIRILEIVLICFQYQQKELFLHYLFVIKTLLVIPTKRFKKSFFVYNTNMEEKILKENIKKILNSAKLVYNSHDFTSSTILYFKTLFSTYDFIILKNTGKIPKDHSERFRILESKFPNLYNVLDKIFPIYRDTYTTIIPKKTCNEIKENVERIIKEQRIFENN